MTNSVNALDGTGSYSSLPVLLTGAGRTGGCRWACARLCRCRGCHRARTPDPSRSRARYRRSCHKPPRRDRVALSQPLRAVSRSVYSSWSSGLIDHQGISRGALIQGLQASLLSLKPNKCARFSVSCHVVERWELALIFNMKNSIDVELLL